METVIAVRHARPSLPFPADQVPRLDQLDGRAMVIAARNGWLQPAVADLVAELRTLLPQHGIAVTVRRLGLPEPFVMGCAIEIAVGAASERPPAGPAQ